MLIDATTSRRRRLLAGLLGLLILLPVLFVADRTADVCRNIVYWDEFDTALALVLRLHEGTAQGGFIGEMFALNNEHRMVTSRLLYAASYRLTGTLNFSFIALAGNASLVALCVMLIVNARTTPRRLRLAAMLAAFLFHLGHYENFMWSGASIDHFQVVLLAGAAIVTVARGTRGGVLAGALFATLATFTLAHGMIVWVAGAALLHRARDRRQLPLWCALGAMAVGGFLIGFRLNRAQEFAGLSGNGAVTVLRYWLTLVGSAAAADRNALAPWLGGALLAAMSWLGWRGALRRERVGFGLALYAIAALALIAAGRAAESHGVVHSRYLVLSALAWALTGFMMLERYSHPRRPYLLIGAVLPVLAAFNVAANRAFADKADTWSECRDRAALRYLQHGADGKGAFRLHPVPAHATALLQHAERTGVYRMGMVCDERPFPAKARPSTRIAYFVDEMTVNERSAFIGGWAAIPGLRSERGKIHLVLRAGPETHLFTSVTATRPDVAEATRQPGWVLSGFRFARDRARLPTGDFQVGFLIEHDGGAEYIMTAHRLQLVGGGHALLATGE